MVNLLPWREQRRLYQNKKIKQVIFMAFCLGVGSILFFLSVTQYQIVYLNKHVENVKQSLLPYHSVAQIVRREEWEAQAMQAIQDLLVYRKHTALFFQNLTQPFSQQVCFDAIDRQHGAMTFSGRARSSEDFTAFLKKWPRDKLFSEIKIQQLMQQDDQQMKFQFQAIENHALSN